MPGWVQKTKKILLNLLLEYNSPRQLAFAVALGIYVGASPLWGLHTVLAVGLAFLFRLNKSAVIVASYFIANPVFLPIILFASLQGGSLILYGHPAPLALPEIRTLLQDPNWHRLLDAYLVPYFVGAFIVGLVPAILSYWITLWVSRHTRNGGKPRSKGSHDPVQEEEESSGT